MYAFFCEKMRPFVLYFQRLDCCMAGNVVDPSTANIVIVCWQRKLQTCDAMRETLALVP
jgi:hypothetical protein